MKIKELKIKHNNWAKDNEGNYIEGGLVEGFIEFENQKGSIKINVSDDLCNSIITLCLGQISLTCAEQIKELNECFKDSAKKSPSLFKKINQALLSEKVENDKSS